MFLFVKKQYSEVTKTDFMTFGEMVQWKHESIPVEQPTL